jgi:hypothetical protein
MNWQIARLSIQVSKKIPARSTVQIGSLSTQSGLLIKAPEAHFGSSKFKSNQVY